MSKLELKKGEKAEERLRSYFLNLGYFVVRSVNASFQGFEVTDVDLFLYSRTSPISRERTNVDVKMKQRPQALERIFWTKGLQDVLGLEKCIVATTDKRSHVGDFGAKNSVLVLDGNFMQKLDSAERFSTNRLDEEEFTSLLANATLGELGCDWKKEFEKVKANLITKLDFEGLNELLNRIKYFMNECCSGNGSEACYRALYSSISYFLITLDYSLKDVSYKEHRERVLIISDGIRFGEKGKIKSEEIVAMSSALMASFMNRDDYDVNAIKNEVYAQFMAIPADDLAEYLGSTKIMQRLLPMAIEFEGLAYNREFCSPIYASTEIQSIIGLLCDFNSLDRKQILI
ncbi:hypothetical protein [Shewanella ulleungensis]|jgi:hypothetical protein|uniref:Restriction endonuclease n=1 Tax=Shewanella ulleungensis TaxID=2282699 RepID=A0ABQ2QEU3_9GAMM|nr:hypothetical protein [Shewanella ulleungensis]MCL1149407.1 hypothetical protein [Shewanella ulleungensis]GGP78947.1 hypothetical protein GCM10009410_09070 [Shewanella ulleungensis]